MNGFESSLMVGLVLAQTTGLLSALVPEDFFTQYLRSEWLSMIVVMGLGIPLYVCSTGSIPIAAALMLKGMSPGAALVFLLAGPSTNAVTITVVSDLPPPDLGNTLLAFRSSTNVELLWQTVPEAKSHSLCRSITKGVWVLPFLEEIAGTTQTLPDVSDADSYFYRVAGASCSGVEGP